MIGVNTPYVFKGLVELKKERITKDRRFVLRWIILKVNLNFTSVYWWELER